MAIAQTYKARCKQDDDLLIWQRILHHNGYEQQK